VQIALFKDPVRIAL